MGPVDREISWELDHIYDNLALEFVEELLLNFEVNPLFQIIVDRALAAGEFIRDSVIVSIADNDGKTIDLFCMIVFAYSMLKVIHMTTSFTVCVNVYLRHTSQHWECRSLTFY